jgi:hypothetical protein
MVFISCFYNECRGKSCGEIVKIIFKKVIKVERRARKKDRATKVCKHFASTI